MKHYFFHDSTQYEIRDNRHGDYLILNVYQSVSSTEVGPTHKILMTYSEEIKGLIPDGDELQQKIEELEAWVKQNIPVALNHITI